jgi:hypothetical protein
MQPHLDLKNEEPSLDALHDHGAGDAQRLKVDRRVVFVGRKMLD